MSKIEMLRKGIAYIQKATEDPRTMAVIAKVLPKLGVSPTDLASLDVNHQDYQQWLAEPWPADGAKTD